VSESALETHFFQIIHLKHDDVTNNFLLLPPPPCSSSFVFYNCWVVPYNPYLTMRYQCHINVKVYSSITSVKYLYKYVYKGHDHALAVVQPEARALPTVAPQAVTGGANGNNVHAARDEVENYFDGRYVSASEACHRLFAFDLHDMHPNVYRLVVHLPNEQTIYFAEGTTVREAMMRNNSTTLIGWCDFNQKAKSEYAAAATLARNNNDPAPPLLAALTTLYPDYLEITVWSKSKKAWHLRKRAHWELWGACTLCNLQRASVIICEFCLPTLQGPHALRTSELPTGPTRLPQLCTPLLKLPALHVGCCKMMLNGTSAF
jgi:hypothetical protein